MANLSDANVEIYAEGVGKELLEYINTTNKSLSDYAIVYEGYSVSEDEKGNTKIDGSSSGRWSYSNNLEGYFDPAKVKGWLGVDADYAWLDDEARKKEYQEQSSEQYAAYLKLVEALKKTGGRIEISYTDCDPAMDWMGTGGATIEVEDGEIVYLHSFDDEPLTIASFAEQQGEDLFWALEYLHGEEVGEAYARYEEQCKKEGKEVVEPDTWYDTIYDYEDN